MTKIMDQMINQNFTGNLQKKKQGQSQGTEY